MIKNKNDFKSFNPSNQKDVKFPNSELNAQGNGCDCCRSNQSSFKKPFGNQKSMVESSRARIFDNYLLDYKGAALYLQVSESYLRRLKMRGVIPFVSMGPRAVRFKVASLDLWTTSREVNK